MTSHQPTSQTPTAPARDSVAFLLLMASVVVLPLTVALMGRLANAATPPVMDRIEVVAIG